MSSVVVIAKKAMLCCENVACVWFGIEAVIFMFLSNNAAGTGLVKKMVGLM